MLRLKAFAIATCLGLFGFAIAPNAQADQWNKRTIMTINEPLQVPNTVLQPGKYVMRLHDSPANRHIVQIFNEDESRLITTVLAIPNYRLRPTGETQFTFWETPAGQPAALRAWFYPGDLFGQEFAYKRSDATVLAQANNTVVPTTEATEVAELQNAPVRTMTPAGQEQELGSEYTQESSTASAATQSSTTQSNEGQYNAQENTQVAQNTMPQSTVGSSNQGHMDNSGDMNNNRNMGDADRSREELPSTASNVPVLALAGLLALGAAVGTGLLARRIA